MSRGAAAADSIAVAISFFQAPGRFADLLRGRARLPADMSDLLHLAAGGNGEIALPPFVTVDEARQSALFFIEQVLFAHNADHYRVLGVNADAAGDEIKEHHRLLMRIFHPDRQAAPEERKDAFATRINLAYGALRTPAARAAYDLSLQQARAAEASVRVGRVETVTAGGAGVVAVLPPVVARNLPQFVLAGVALLAALAVVSVYLSQMPPGAIGAGDGELTQVPAPIAVPRVDRPNPAESPIALTQSTLLQESAIRVAPPTTSEAAAGDTRRPVPVANLATASDLRAVTAVALTPVVREVNRSLPVSAARSAPAAEVLRSAALSPVETAAPTEAPATPANLQASLRPEQIDPFLARFSSLYERGDVDGLLALFDESARIERGGKARIRADYSDLFATTETRQLHVWDMNWTTQGEVVRGEGSFQARIVRKGETALRTYNGTIRFELRRRNDAPIIIGLFHSAH